MPSTGAKCRTFGLEATKDEMKHEEAGGLDDGEELTLISGGEAAAQNLTVSTKAAGRGPRAGGPASATDIEERQMRADILEHYHGKEP